jgi:hypothetical protein
MSEEPPDTSPPVSSYGFAPPIGSDGLADYAEEVSRAAAQNTILVGELHHRLQNTLTIVPHQCAVVAWPDSGRWRADRA